MRFKPGFYAAFLMTILRRVTFFLAALVLFALPAVAQQIEARVVGKVVDQSQAALPGRSL